MVIIRWIHALQSIDLFSHLVSLLFILLYFTNFLKVFPGNSLTSDSVRRVVACLHNIHFTKTIQTSSLSALYPSWTHILNLIFGSLLDLGGCVQVDCVYFG